MLQTAFTIMFMGKTWIICCLGTLIGLCVKSVLVKGIFGIASYGLVQKVVILTVLLSKGMICHKELGLQECLSWKQSLKGTFDFSILDLLMKLHENRSWEAF